jgi:hypothetical protein
MNSTLSSLIIAGIRLQSKNLTFSKKIKMSGLYQTERAGFTENLGQF